MSPIPASVFILTKNEAHNIERVLTSVRDFEDIVVLDSGSTDNTVELARKFTDRVYVKPWLGWSRITIWLLPSIRTSRAPRALA